MKRWLIFLCALWFWVQGFVLLDWAVNLGCAYGMTAPLWMWQNLDGSIFYVSNWHAYVLSLILIHVGLVLFSAFFKVEAKK